MPEWQLLIEKKVSAHELRKDFVHAHTNLLNSIGIAGNVLLHDYPTNWKEKLGALKNIDWSKSNQEWEGRLLLKGRMLKSRLGIELAANTILEKCGVTLSGDRLSYEKKND